MSDTTHKKTQYLFIILSGVFLTNAVLAEFIGVKIFSVEDSMGIPPARLRMPGGLVLDFNLAAGAVIWPVVFIVTDIINEYFGKSGVRRISFLAAGLIGYAFFVVYIITLLSPAGFWMEINSVDPAGNPFDINYAFKVVFTQSMGIILGSLTSFLVSQLLDVYVFQSLRKLTGERKIWLRATGSTLVSQLVDSFVVISIAFYVLAPASSRWSISQVVSVGLVSYSYKFAVAILLTPLIYLVHFIIDRYLGEDADRVKQEAAGQASPTSPSRPPAL